jgi:hypothetical protein
MVTILATSMTMKPLPECIAGKIALRAFFGRDARKLRSSTFGANSFVASGNPRTGA